MGGHTTLPWRERRMRYLGRLSVLRLRGASGSRRRDIPDGHGGAGGIFV